MSDPTAMQTDAAPALKPAAEVWRDAYAAYVATSIKAAAAVIEADRQAIIAAKDAEIAALKDAWQKQFDEKVKERNEAKLWFEKAQEWKQSLAALQAHADALAKELDYMIDGSAANHPSRFVLRAYEEFRR